MHRRYLDRPHWGKLNYYSRPDPSFFKMPLKSYSHTYHANSETNLLCLPGELILDILDVLAPLDILSFRTASKYIWSLASTKSVQTRIQKHLFSLGDLDEHAWRLRKDRFDRLAEYEHADDALNWFSPREKFLCSYCVDLHPLPAFTTVIKSDGARSAHRRQCSASKAKVYVCPHKQLAFDDLLRLHKDPGTTFMCSLCIPSFNVSTRLPPCEDCFTLKANEQSVSRLYGRALVENMVPHAHQWQDHGHSCPSSRNHRWREHIPLFTCRNQEKGLQFAHGNDGGSVRVPHNGGANCCM
jgi:hypothetical protein